MFVMAWWKITCARMHMDYDVMLECRVLQRIFAHKIVVDTSMKDKVRKLKGKYLGRIQSRRTLFPQKTYALKWLYMTILFWMKLFVKI